MPDGSLRARWEDAARLVAGHRDVLGARPDDGETPEALVARGWAPFLTALDDAALDAVEVDGLEAAWPAGAPPSLGVLLAEARRVCSLPLLGEPGPLRDRAPRRAETPRKRAQIDAFSRVILPLASDAERIVDVGSGHGHLTREIAERIARPVVGLERSSHLALRARDLASGGSVAGAAPAALTFAITDVLADGLPVADGDCLIGLHACGDLADAMVESVARARASLAVVGCCLQKRRALSRRSLCAGDRDDLELPRALLGLSNMTPRDVGVEATRSENLAGRERRLALHRLLAAGGPGLRLGAEIEGLNRRAAQGDLLTLVERAFALRSRPRPSDQAIDEAASWARAQHARSRRLSLPRVLLARALEVFVLLDRAVYLEERGFAVAIGALFPASVSARNLALVARPRCGAAAPPGGV